MTTVQEATPENEWATLREFLRDLAEKQAETDRQLKASQAEFDRRMKENDQQLKASKAEFDQNLKASKAEFDRKMDKVRATLGAWADNQGTFAEDYFYNSFENGQQNFFGEKFDEIEKNLKNRRMGITDEYDIVLYNHSSVALIEVKYKAHKNDVPVVLKKAENFRILFPDYKDFKIYLGLASMSFDSELEEECINKGIMFMDFFER